LLTVDLDLVVPGGIFVNKNLTRKLQNLAVYQPGDKLYQLFKHEQAVVKGKKEKFLIKIEKIS
jgi:hypothetical protein